MNTWEIVGIVAVLFLAAILGLALIGGFAYAVIMNRKTRAENRELIAVLKELSANYQKATAAYAEAPQLFKALGGLASRQVQETARLSDAALRLATLIGSSEGASPEPPSAPKHYHAPRTEPEQAIDYQAMIYKQTGVDPEAARQMAEEMYGKEEGVNSTSMVD